MKARNGETSRTFFPKTGDKNNILLCTWLKEQDNDSVAEWGESVGAVVKTLKLRAVSFPFPKSHPGLTFTPRLLR